MQAATVTQSSDVATLTPSPKSTNLHKFPNYIIHSHMKTSYWEWVYEVAVISHMLLHPFSTSRLFLILPQKFNYSYIDMYTVMYIDVLDRYIGV